MGRDEIERKIPHISRDAFVFMTLAKWLTGIIIERSEKRTRRKFRYTSARGYFCLSIKPSIRARPSSLSGQMSDDRYFSNRKVKGTQRTFLLTTFHVVKDPLVHFSVLSGIGDLTLNFFDILTHRRHGIGAIARIINVFNLPVATNKMPNPAVENPFKNSSRVIVPDFLQSSFQPMARPRTPFGSILTSSKNNVIPSSLISLGFSGAV